MRLPRLLAGGMLAAVLTGAAACGLPAAEPKIELRDAMSDFASGRAGTLELSVPSSLDDARAFAEAADPGGAEPTVGDLEELLSSSVDIGYDFGSDRDSTADDASRVVVHLGDLEAGELRAVDGLLYARVDVERLTEKFPGIEADLDSFRAESAIESVTAFLDGEWVSADPEAYLEELAAAAGQPGTAPSDASSAEARDLMGAALKDAVTSVDRRGADDELGNHLVAGLDLRRAYATLRSGLPDLFDDEMAASLEQQLPPVDEIPEKRIDVSFWVRDGDLARVELDVAQFLDEPAGHLVLRADVRAPQEITAPSDAVEFDLRALIEAQMATTYETADADQLEPDAYMIATWLDEDIAVRAEKLGVPSSIDLLSDVAPYYDGIAKTLEITAVGERIQVTLLDETVCLTLSPDGYGEDIAEGTC